ncbi:MAG: ATP-dependent sacrificial sulfur transferase LarE [Nitrospirae bacterium]|nr:ATP-dependent sacrificial sulfur transferase LarE [Nitrospirota bacterium]
MVIDQKWEHLKALLHEMKPAVLAYSGGVDSSLLLRAASEVMGQGLIAVTAVSETYPAGELQSAEHFARSLGVTHRILHTHELASEDFVKNSPDRCYFCKTELFEKLRKIADTEGISFVIDGSNTDDLNDHRPGRRAAGEHSVRSPLVEAGLSKSEVRELARGLELSVWDKPSLACLSSRIPYGTRITPAILKAVQTAEDHLRAHGFRQVRVRHHGDLARIEVDPMDFAKLLSSNAAEQITAALKEIGYTYVCLDLAGYRTGSMNEGMRKRHEGRETRDDGRVTKNLLRPSS